MITKITSSNADLYYAPRFAEITEAFAIDYERRPELYENDNGPIVIKSLEDYFYNLTEIAALQVGAKNIKNAYLLVAPADEDIFAIDANTRAIDVPSFIKKHGIGVYGDHRAEMIVMTIDRYFDHEDFLRDKIAINWNFTPSNAKTPIFAEPQAVEAFAPNEELNPGKITFGFIITKDMTPSRGTLTFSVTIYDTDSDEIVYSFNTTTASVAINDTLTLTNPGLVKSDVDNYVGRLTNSVYVDNTISPVGTPYWAMDLGEKAYLLPREDEANVYEEGVILQARAKVDPNTADIAYKWIFAPIDGNIETAREFETINVNADYIDTVLPVEADDTIYFAKNILGVVDAIHPLTWAQAKAMAEEDEDVEFVVRGTSFRAMSAGKYQVHAQARISAGENYEKFLGTVEQLKVNNPYYKKDANDNIINYPVMNEDAVAALNNGEELFVLVSAARNSIEADSTVLTIPAAVKPSVSLGVESSFEFGDNVVLKDPDSIYTYISGNDLVITATVYVDGNNEDKAGAFAVELIENGAPDLTKADIEAKIASEELEFNPLPPDGVFTITPSGNIAESEYMVRAINRRNGTYSVSDPSDKIYTSKVARSINEITVQAVISENELLPVLVSGRRPNNTLVELEVSNQRDHYDFILTDLSDNDDRAHVYYYIEEVDYVDGQVIPRGDDAQDRDEKDEREIVMGNSLYNFSITADPGYYRIKTINYYNGTACTAYTDIFKITSTI